MILSGLNPVSPSFRNKRTSLLPRCPLCLWASWAPYPLLRNLGYSCIDGGLQGLGTGRKFLGTRRVELGGMVKRGHSRRSWGLWLHICASLSLVSTRSLLRWVTELWQYQDAAMRVCLPSPKCCGEVLVTPQGVLLALFAPWSNPSSLMPSK